MVGLHLLEIERITITSTLSALFLISRALVAVEELTNR